MESISDSETIHKGKDLKVSGSTDTGRFRDHNEDNFLIDKDFGLFAVADGVGGHQAGEKASEVLVKSLSDQIKAELKNLEEMDYFSLAGALEASLRSLNRKINRDAAEKPELNGMGATVVAVFIREENAYIAHMGDSRVYLLREGAIECLTEDHSIVGWMKRMGNLSPREAKKHPLRHMITRYMGMEGDFGPDVGSIELKSGDRLLLCSDGLTDMVSDRDIGTILLNTEETEAVCKALIDSANEAGGKDNITVVIIQYGGFDNREGREQGGVVVKRSNASYRAILSYEESIQ